MDQALGSPRKLLHLVTLVQTLATLPDNYVDPRLTFTSIKWISINWRHQCLYLGGGRNLMIQADVVTILRYGLRLPSRKAPRTGRIWIVYLECTGTEASLAACNHRTGYNNCRAAFRINCTNRKWCQWHFTIEELHKCFHKQLRTL